MSNISNQNYFFIKISILLISLVCLNNFSLYAQESASSPSSVLRIGTMDLPPYGWKERGNEKKGIIFEMNEQIGVRSGLKFTNDILPFSRMLLLLEKGQLDLISSQAHSKSLKAGDKLAIQFKINVIAGTRKGAAIKTFEDLKGKSFIYHRSASYKQLNNYPKRISRVNSYEQILKMLKSQPLVDAGVFSEPAYYFWMKGLDFKVKDFGNVVMIETGKEQWIIVRKDMSKDLRAKLLIIVNEIYNEKMYDKLLLKYGKGH